MKSNASGCVDITLDLGPYISAYEKAYGSDGRARHKQVMANVEFKKLSFDIYKQLDGIPGQMHWVKALTLATQNLDKKQQNAIEASPAADMMANSFIEIIKNSMDEAVSSHYDSQQKQAPVIQLSIKIDHTSHPDLISIQIIDSGHGFPDEFLAKVSTQQARDAYVNTSRGSTREKHPDRPPLFGGQGRGLRILIADEDGDVLERSSKRTRRFTKPEVSSITFANAVDKDNRIQGAQITVTTSIEPREDLAMKVREIKENFQADMRAHRAVSPTASVATTHESISSRSSSRNSSPLTIDLDMDYLGDDDSFSDSPGDSPAPIQTQKNKPRGLDLDFMDQDEEDDLEDDGSFSPKR